LLLQVNQGLLQEALALSSRAQCIAPGADGLVDVHAEQCTGLSVIGKPGVVPESQVVAEKE